MDKTVVIVHGAEGNPQENWFPWLKEQVESEGWRAVVPAFPTPEGQEPGRWLEVLDREVQLGPDTAIAAHSIGCGLVLRALERPGEPVAASVLASGFLGEIGSPDYDPLNAPFFVEDFDFDTIRARAGEVVVLNGENDPYVPFAKGEELAAALGTTVIGVPDGGHLNTAAGFTEFPVVWERIRAALAD